MEGDRDLRKAPVKGTSLESIPAEIYDEIFGYLQPGDLAKLALISRALYAAVQTPLYHRPIVKSYYALTLFVRTLNQVCQYATKSGQWKWWKEDKPLSKDVSHLSIIIDPILEGVRNGGQRPTAVLIGRLVNSVVAHCPRINITLTMVRASCFMPPMTALERENFYRVSKLVLYLGHTYPQPRVGFQSLPTGSAPHDSASSSSASNNPVLFPTHAPGPLGAASRRARYAPDSRAAVTRNCRPGPGLWCSLFNGDSFPDCEVVEVHHFWALPPPQPEHLDEISSYRISWDDYGDYGGAVDDSTNLAGLRKIKSLVLEAVPELNDRILMASLSRAANLKSLELRYCKLSPYSLAKLLPHALPNLTRFKLLISEHSTSAANVARLVDCSVEGDGNEIPHLCPLFREFGRNLTHLEYANPFICRELFFDRLEMRRIEEAGVGRNDRYAIRNVISTFRKQRNDKLRKIRIAEAVADAKTKAGTAKPSSMFGGGPSDEQIAGDTAREMERTLDDEEKRRTRLINDAKGGWDRRVVCWTGLCRSEDQWEEIQEAANLEEDEVKWIVANGDLKLVSSHLKGRMHIDLDYEEEICGKLPVALSSEN